MSFCPICDELIVDKDVFALGCGHLLCDACLSQLIESDRIKECPLCKKCIYQSEIRKIFLNTANDNLIDSTEKKTIENNTLVTRLNNAKIQNQILKERNNELQISYKKNSEELEEVRNKYSDENGKYKQLRTRYENIKSDYRTLQKDFQLLKKQVDEVTDYIEARKWIEDHTKGIEDLISTASEEDRSCSRRLAVILLTVREKYQKDLVQFNKTSLEVDKLRLENKKKEEYINALRKEVNGMKEKGNERRNVHEKKQKSLHSSYQCVDRLSSLSK